MVNPVPLGLFGFALNSVLFAGANLGLYAFNGVLLASALLLGGLAQFIAGLFCGKQGDSFGLTSFVGFALYWWSLIVMICAPELNQNWQPTSTALVFYNGVWMVFTVQLGWLARKLSRADCIIFACLAIVYLMLGLFALTAVSMTLKVAGLAGAIAGITALYTAQDLLAKTLKRAVVGNE
jgi:hypothetical protein